MNIPTNLPKVDQSEAEKRMIIGRTIQQEMEELNIQSLLMPKNLFVLPGGSLSLKQYLLNQVNIDLMWVQAAAYGAAWLGYNRDDMNAADAVCQILRIATIERGYAIEFWQRGKPSTFTLHADSWQKVLLDLNSVIETAKFHQRKLIQEGKS